MRIGSATAEASPTRISLPLYFYSLTVPLDKKKSNAILPPGYVAGGRKNPQQPPDLWVYPTTAFN